MVISVDVPISRIFGNILCTCTYSKLPDLGRFSSRNLKKDLGMVSPSKTP